MTPDGDTTARLRSADGRFAFVFHADALGEFGRKRCDLAPDLIAREAQIIGYFSFRRHSGHRRTCRRLDPAAIDPNVWSGRPLQEVFVELPVCGLASMYPASDWS